MMAYVFANVAFFRKGFEYLNELENEMRTDTQTIAKEEEQVIEQTQKRISKIQSLQKVRLIVIERRKKEEKDEMIRKEKDTC